LWILEECRRFWKAQDREIDDTLLTHLAGSAPAFESLINPADARFVTAGDMPLKVQAFCRETRQPVPRKPGAVIRCILESLALSYRQTLEEIEELTGRPMARLYLLGGSSNDLLKHFIANAARRPVVAAPPDAGRSERLDTATGPRASSRRPTRRNADWAAYAKAAPPNTPRAGDGLRASTAGRPRPLVVVPQEPSGFNHRTLT